MTKDIFVGLMAACESDGLFELVDTEYSGLVNDIASYVRHCQLNDSDRLVWRAFAAGVLAAGDILNADTRADALGVDSEILNPLVVLALRNYQEANRKEMSND